MAAERLNADDRAMVTALYDDSVERLHRFVSNLPKGPDSSSNHDLVSYAYKSAVENWHRISAWDRARQIGWLRQVCRNRRIDELRREVRLSKLIPRMGPDAPVADPQSVALDRIALEACEVVIRNMPARQREVAQCAWLLLMSREDIAATLGITRAAVRVHLARARRALEEEVGPHLPFSLNDQGPGGRDGNAAKERWTAK